MSRDRFTSKVFIDVSKNEQNEASQVPKGFEQVGIVHCFLAAFFVLWFLLLPEKGAYFAYPVVQN